MLMQQTAGISPLAGDEKYSFFVLRLKLVLTWKYTLPALPVLLYLR